MQTRYKKHVLENTLDELKNRFCINNTLCHITGNSLTL